MRLQGNVASAHLDHVAEGDPDQAAELSGYVFAVSDRAFCCWEWDLIDRTLRFLTSLDVEYYRQVAATWAELLGTDADMSASIALRNAYHQGIETLFSLLGAYVQAPHAVPAWLAHCRTEDLEKVVRAMCDGSALLTQNGRQIVTFDLIAEDVFRACEWIEAGSEATSSRFATTWSRLAEDFLDPELRDEYNSIKHGLRVSPGGFSFAIGEEEVRGVPVSPERMRSLGGSQYGSTFLRSEKVSRSKHHVRTRRISLNWSAEAMMERLELISMSIANIVGALRCSLGIPPGTVQFVRPSSAATFGHAWSHHVGTRSVAIDTIVHIDAADELSAEALLAHLAARNPDPAHSRQKA